MTTPQIDDSEGLAANERIGQTILDVISPELATATFAVQEAMIAKFELPTPAVEVIPLPNGHLQPHPLVMLTGPSGLMSYEHDPIITVGGKPLDTSKGIGIDAYHAFINFAKAQGRDPLPDSHKAAKINKDYWTWTLLSGEEPISIEGHQWVLYGTVKSNDLPHWEWVNVDRIGNPRIRIRPAVVIDEALVDYLKA